MRELVKILATNTLCAALFALLVAFQGGWAGFVPSFLVASIYANLIGTSAQRRQLVELAKVSHFVAQGTGTLAMTAAGSHLVDHPLGELEERHPARTQLQVARDRARAFKERLVL